MAFRSLFCKTAALAAISASLVMAPAAFAQKHIQQNLTQLVGQAHSIVSGEVLTVTDGFDDRKRPYTEITLRVAGDMKGKLLEGSSYTFRQFGLTKPRSMGNGKIYLGVSPEGFATWHVGEHVIAFLNPTMGGLTSTVGLEQGKFNLDNGKVSNNVGNLGLFDGMDPSKFSSEQQNLMTGTGAVDAAGFLDMVSILANGGAE